MTSDDVRPNQPEWDQQLPARLVFNLQAAYPKLAEELIGKVPALSPVLRTLINHIPLPQLSAIECPKYFYRLANQNRSFCYALDDCENIYRSPVIVFKGAEPLLADFDKVIDWMLLAPFRASSQVMADHFPLIEGKIPGALSLKEATREASIAAEIQSKHYRFYDELARLPMPLAVHKISEDSAEECAELLRRKLSPIVFDRIDPVLNTGLGIYVYYYPVAPVRADAQGGGGDRKLTEYIGKHCPPETTVSRWIQLLARMLYLGYLPCTPRTMNFGACMDFGNATLDGGFCDPDSVQSIASSPDDEFFFESLVTSLMILEGTITRLASPGCGLEDNALYPNFEKFLLSRYVSSAFERALEVEARPGLSLDKRVLDILSPKRFGDLRKLLQRRYRPYSLSVFLRREC